MKLNKKQTGFTIVELLIVIVVIAILAAISIVAYNGIQDRANNSTVAANLIQLGKRLEMAKVDLGHYPKDIGQMPQWKINTGSWDGSLNNAYYCHNTETGEYAIGARSKSLQGYQLTSFSGVSQRGSVSGNHTCQIVGKNWGDPGTFVMQGYSNTSGNWQAWTN